jgi:hypothetical protein
MKPDFRAETLVATLPFPIRAGGLLIQPPSRRVHCPNGQRTVTPNRNPDLSQLIDQAQTANPDLSQFIDQAQTPTPDRRSTP